MQLVKEGSRLYFEGAPYGAKDAIKNLGGHWDGERGSWWIGVTKQTEAAALMTKISGGGAIKPTYKKVGDDWVVYGPASVVKAGSTVSVLKSSGAEKDEAIISVQPAPSQAGLDYVYGSVAPREKKQRSAKNYQGGQRQRTTCRECHGPLVNAPHHRAMGGYCGHCAFDEYDM